AEAVEHLVQVLALQRGARLAYPCELRQPLLHHRRRPVQRGVLHGPPELLDQFRREFLVVVLVVGGRRDRRRHPATDLLTAHDSSTLRRSCGGSSRPYSRQSRLNVLRASRRLERTVAGSLPMREAISSGS